MLSRIQDLPRFKADMKRFQLGIDSTGASVHQQGVELLENLINAIKTFDGTTTGLVRKEGHSGHMDHVSAQETVRQAKDEMEIWMTQYAPDVHVDHSEFEQTTDSLEMDK